MGSQLKKLFHHISRNYCQFSIILRNFFCWCFCGVFIFLQYRAMHILIAHYRVAFRLCFKASPSAKPFIWKLVLFTFNEPTFARE